MITLPVGVEGRDPRTRGLDAWPDAAILDALWESQGAAIAAVRAALPALGDSVAAAHARLRHDGRLFYIGAGTSGRIAAQDGAELAPTFNWPSERLVLLLAGGAEALTTGIEGAEDDEPAAEQAIGRHAVTAQDVVLGIAASGRTPYTCAAIAAARAAGALTIGFANVAQSRLLHAAELPLLLETGPEVIAGSTRLKAGTAQKAALNLFSTLLMVRLGRVHDGHMVDMRSSNAKLRERAVRIVGDIAPCSPEAAAQALQATHGDIKAAVLVTQGLSVQAASSLLAAHDGHLRAALLASQP